MLFSVLQIFVVSHRSGIICDASLNDDMTQGNQVSETKIKTIPVLISKFVSLIIHYNFRTNFANNKILENK